MIQLIFGCGLSFFLLGGLSQRAVTAEQLLPPLIEAGSVGLVFALAALPSRWAMLPRALFVLPSFLVFLDILESRSPPMPFPAAFLTSAWGALFVTACSAYLAERGMRSR